MQMYPMQRRRLFIMACILAQVASMDVQYLYPEEDDRTLLDTFGEAAKEYLTQKVVSR